VCWGDNTYGQRTVPLLSHPVAVNAGWSHTCALDDHGVVCWGLNDNGQTSVPALSFDKDRDGLTDAIEDANGNGVVDAGETDPLNPDTDGDGLVDGVETNTGIFVNFADTGTDPINPDTDGDGFNDGEEIAAGTNPLDNTSHPIVANGDVNGDGQVDVGDLLLAMRILTGQYIPSQEEQARWDVAPLVNGMPAPDGQNNSGDYLILQRKVLGLVNF